MNFTRDFFLYAGISSFSVMILGFYKPWIVLWWAAVQTRRKTIKVYGTISLLSFLVFWILG